MKTTIFIVEDEAILYERLRRLLLKEGYTVSDYLPSVAEAKKELTKQLPDLVLLDIDLQGTETGLDLGKYLSDNYNIPFIYLTSLQDNQTFYQGLATHHDAFILKTKPRLDSREIIRTIQTVLAKQNNKFIVPKKGVMGLVSYLEELKQYTDSQITKVPVAYSDIAFFSKKTFLNENDELEIVRENYIWFQTLQKEYYFLKTSLRSLQSQLPPNFCRINEGTIVNLSPDFYNGSILGDKIVIGKTTFVIGATYKSNLRNQINRFYLVE